MALYEGTKVVHWRGKTIQVEPLPWYLDYIQAARECGVPPWEMFDEWTPREFWKHAVLIVLGAESAARETKAAYREAMGT